MRILAAVCVPVVALAAWLSLTPGCERPKSEEPPPQAEQGARQDPGAVGATPPEARTAPEQVPAAAPPPPAPRLVLDEPLPAKGVEIEWAAWGDRDCSRVVEVTDLVREHLASAGSVTSNDPELLKAMGDPLPGEQKWLTLVLKTPSGHARVGLAESILYLTIPPEKIPPAGSGERWTQDEAGRADAMLVDGVETGIVWARWGNDGNQGGWSDAQTPVQAQLDFDGTIFNKTAGMPDVRKPNNLRTKTLRLLLAIDGQPVGFHLRRNSYVSLRPTDELVARPGAFHVGPGGLDAPYVTAKVEGAGQVAMFTPSGDGAFLYALDNEGPRLLKVDAETMEVVAEISGLAPGYACMVLTPDGTTLYLGGAADGYDRNRERTQMKGIIATIDTESFAQRGPPKQVRCDILAMGWLKGGRLIALDGSSGGFLAIIDPRSGVIVGESPAGGPRDYHVMHPDGEHLLMGHGNGINCRWLDPDVEPGKLVGHDSTHAPGVVQSHGHFQLIDDARYLIGFEGALVRVSQNFHQMFLGVMKLPQNSGGILSRELGVLVVATQNGMQVLSWPEFQPVVEVFGKGVLADMTFAGSGRYAHARWLPDAVLGGSNPPQGGTSATLVTIDLASLIPEDYVRPEPEPTPRDETDGPFSRRLPTRTDIAGLVMPTDGSALYALDAAAGQVLRIDPTTLDIVARSGALPFSTNTIAIDPAGKHLVVGATPALYASNKEREGGTLVQLDPETLEPVGSPLASRVDPAELAIDARGHLFVSGGSNQHTTVLEIDLSTGREVDARGCYMRTSICVSPDSSAIFRSSRGVSPAGFEGIRIGGSQKFATADPVPIETQKDTSAGNQIWITTDGRYVVAMSGGVYRVPTARERARIIGLGSLEQVCGSAGAGRFLYACDHTNALTTYEMPGLEARNQLLLDGTLTEMCFDPATDRLYGVHRRGGKFEGHEGFSGEIMGDIVVIEGSTLAGG